MTTTETTRSPALHGAPLTATPLAAGLFGGAREASRRVEALVEPVASDPAAQAAARRQSFSDLFRIDGAQLHAA